MGFGSNLTQTKEQIENEEEVGADVIQKKMVKPKTIRRKTKKPSLKDDDDMGYEGFGPSTVD